MEIEPLARTLFEAMSSAQNPQFRWGAWEKVAACDKEIFREGVRSIVDERLANTFQNVPAVGGVWSPKQHRARTAKPKIVRGWEPSRNYNKEPTLLVRCSTSRDGGGWNDAEQTIELGIFLAGYSPEDEANAH